MGWRFEQGREYEEVIKTKAGAFWVTASVAVHGNELELYGFLFYPVTARPVSVGYTAIRTVFRHIEDVAREEGYASCTLNAYRAKGAGRMLSRKRILR